LKHKNALSLGLSLNDTAIASKSQEDVELRQIFAAGANNVKKQLDTSINYVEQELNIDTGALHTAYNRARQMYGLGLAAEQEVEDRILVVNSMRISAAMTWIVAPTFPIDMMFAKPLHLPAAVPQAQSVLMSRERIPGVKDGFGESTVP
jgi:hypothetical protein